MQHSACAWYLPWGVPQPKMISMPATAAAAAATFPDKSAQTNALAAAAVGYPLHGAVAACQVPPNLQQQQQQQQQQHQQVSQQLHQHSPNSGAATPQQTNYSHAAAAAAAAAAAGLHPSAAAANAQLSPLAAAYSSYTQLTNALPNASAAAHLQSYAAAAAAAAAAAQMQQQQQQTQLLHQHQQQQQQHHHPAAATAANAAAMFTPLSLGTFLSAAAALNGQTLLTSSATAQSAAQQQQQSQLAHHHHQQHQLQQQQQQQQQQLQQQQQQLQQQQLQQTMNLNLGIMALGSHHLPSVANGLQNGLAAGIKVQPNLLAAKKLTLNADVDRIKSKLPEKRKPEDSEQIKDLKKAKLETKALKAKRPGFTDERYQETSYYTENGLRKVYPYYFTFTTFTKGRWVGEKILDVFAREFRAHPAEEYERCIQTGTLTVNFEKVPIDYRLRHNDLLANIVHRHEVPVTCQPITIVHIDEDIVVVNKPASIPVHPCGRYRHNTVVFILAKEFDLKNLRTIHRLDRLTSGLLLFGRSPKKARQMEQQIRNRQVQKEYICRVEGVFPDGIVECKEPIEVVSYKIGVCKVSSKGKECTTSFQKISECGNSSVVLCKPLTGRMHQIRVHLQYLGYPILNDPLYNHEVFGPLKGRGGDLGGKNDDELIRDLINIHNAENWLGIDCESDMSLFNTSVKDDNDRESLSSEQTSVLQQSDDDSGTNSRETSPPCVGSPRSTSEVTACNKPSKTLEAEPLPESVPTAQTTIATQTGVDASDIQTYKADKMTVDKHCYECKVHYRDPKPKDLVMYLHAWKYKGPNWEYETELPKWASNEWSDVEAN